MNSLRSYAIRALVAAGSLMLVMGTPALPQALSGTLRKARSSSSAIARPLSHSHITMMPRSRSALRSSSARVSARP
jgi:hypothetical protein